MEKPKRQKVSKRGSDSPENGPDPKKQINGVHGLPTPPTISQSASKQTLKSVEQRSSEGGQKSFPNAAAMLPQPPPCALANGTPENQLQGAEPPVKTTAQQIQIISPIAPDLLQSTQTEHRNHQCGCDQFSAELAQLPEDVRKYIQVAICPENVNSSNCAEICITIAKGILETISSRVVGSEKDDTRQLMETARYFIDISSAPNKAAKLLSFCARKYLKDVSRISQGSEVPEMTDFIYFIEQVDDRLPEFDDMPEEDDEQLSEEATLHRKEALRFLHAAVGLHIVLEAKKNEETLEKRPPELHLEPKFKLLELITGPFSVIEENYKKSLEITLHHTRATLSKLKSSSDQSPQIPPTQNSVNSTVIVENSQHQETQEEGISNFQIAPDRLIDDGDLCQDAQNQEAPLASNLNGETFKQQMLRTYNQMAQSLSSSILVEDDQIRPGIVGLRNMGATCFMSATLQCLFQTPGFREIFSRENLLTYLINNDNQVIATQFAALFDAVWSGMYKVIVSKHILEHFPTLNTGKHEDASEFALRLLTVLQNATERIQGEPFIQNYRGGQEISANAIDYLDKNQKLSSSPIKDILGMTTVTEMTCAICNATSATFETSTILNINLSPTGSCTLETFLDSFFSTEIVDWKCYQCGKEGKSTRSSKIWAPPEVLIVLVGRFLSVARKNNARITFENDYLDLVPYMHCDAPKKNTMFTLYAATHHKGSLASGHYTAVTRHSEDGEWNCFDDEEVKPWDPLSRTTRSTVSTLHFKRICEEDVKSKLTSPIGKVEKKPSMHKKDSHYNAPATPFRQCSRDEKHAHPTSSRSHPYTHHEAPAPVEEVIQDTRVAESRNQEASSQNAPRSQTASTTNATEINVGHIAYQPMPKIAIEAQSSQKFKHNVTLKQPVSAAEVGPRASAGLTLHLNLVADRGQEDLQQMSSVQQYPMKAARTMQTSPLLQNTNQSRMMGENSNAASPTADEEREAVHNVNLKSLATLTLSQQDNSAVGQELLTSSRSHPYSCIVTPAAIDAGSVIANNSQASLKIMSVFLNGKTITFDQSDKLFIFEFVKFLAGPMNGILNLLSVTPPVQWTDPHHNVTEVELNNYVISFNEAVCLWRGQRFSAWPYLMDWAIDLNHNQMKDLLALARASSVENEKKLKGVPYSSGVYGELSVDQMLSIIQELQIGPNDTFVDVGSGIGHLVNTVALTSSAKLSVGIEVDEYRAKIANRYHASLTNMLDWLGKSMGHVQLHRDNVLDPAHKQFLRDHATIIYLNNIQFDSDLMDELREVFESCRPGTRIVSTAAIVSAKDQKRKSRNLRNKLPSIVRLDQLTVTEKNASFQSKSCSIFMITIL